MDKSLVINILWCVIPIYNMLYIKTDFVAVRVIWYRKVQTLHVNHHTVHCYVEKLNNILNFRKYLDIENEVHVKSEQ